MRIRDNEIVVITCHRRGYFHGISPHFCAGSAVELRLLSLTFKADT
ncbi:MAG TPA: hypothetical protein VGJ15_09450 [Pirellulales bacterium]|jgi:hypothetical protein